MALGEAFVRVAIGMPTAAIPDHHGAAAVFAARDGAFELVVFDRMIFDMNGESLVVWVEARAARHRPAFHDAVELKPQIVVQPPRRMFLDHVSIAAARSEERRVGEECRSRWA